jgi:type I restriction enzyme S subunit
MSFEYQPLGGLLYDKGYVRGPFGSALKRQELKSSGIPVYEQQQAIYGHRNFRYFIDEVKHAELRRFTVKPNDLIISCSGTVGRISVIKSTDPIGIISQALLILRPNVQELIPQFLYYFLCSPEGQRSLFAASHGAVQQNIAPRAVVEKILIPLPVLPEQENIVGVLKTLDDRITLLRETNKTLEAIAQAVFKSWFVDFDPVKAKMDGRQPAGMDEETAALFPDVLVESELGLIPKGWEVGTLRRIAELNPEVWSAKNHPPELLYVDLANAKENELASIVSYGFDEAPSRARRVLRCGDTIIGTVRPGNRSYALIYNPPENLTGSTGFAVLRPKENMFTEFIFLAATQDSSIDYFAHLADGAAYPAVRPDVVINLSCVVPPNSLMALFHNLTSPCLAKLGDNQKLMQTLTELRDTLLPRLISGTLCVPIDETEPSEA